MNEERNDDPIAMLIRAAGKRPPIEAAQVARVRAAVHEEWRGQIRRGRTRRWSLAAAGIAAMLAGVLLLVQQRAGAERFCGAVGFSPPGTRDAHGHGYGSRGVHRERLVG